MTSIMSMWVALVVLGSGPEQGLVQPDARDFPQLACYHLSARQFIKEERERLSDDGPGTDDTIAPYDSYNLEQVSELLLEKLYYIIKTLLKPDDNLSLVTVKDSFKNSGNVP